MREKKFTIRFNQILLEEMGARVELKPLQLDPDLKVKYSDDDARSICVTSQLLTCPKTAHLRMGEMDLKGSMIIHFGAIPPAREYDIPILGYTFVYANKCLIVILDLIPIAKESEYMSTYIAPLKGISQKYAEIPTVEGGRTELMYEWVKAYESGYSLYRWCDKKYLPDMENAFRDYIRVFCDCIKKSAPITDPEIRIKRDERMEQYIRDYIANDPGGAPMKMHFGEEWTERYLKDFLFAP